MLTHAALPHRYSVRAAVFLCDFLGLASIRTNKNWNLVTFCIAQMLQGHSDPVTVLQKAQSMALDHIRSATNYADASVREAHMKEFEVYCLARNLQELQLDQGTSIGYTFKAMGAAAVLFQSGQNFRDALTSLTLEGGDADSNGAVAGAVLGCHLGYSALPQDSIRQLPHREWLDTKIDFLLQLMRLK
jgi:ADP-ribosylglycohydrolase